MTAAPEPAASLAVEVAEAEAPIVDGPPSGFDEMAESAFRAEARERGESVAPTAASVESAEETDPKELPPLNDLVQRLSPEVREVLEDLFRAKFIAVKRVPKSALK